MREKAALKKTPPSRRKEQYTPVEIDTGVDEVKLVDSATTDSESSGEIFNCLNCSFFLLNALECISHNLEFKNFPGEHAKDPPVC